MTMPWCDTAWRLATRAHGRAVALIHRFGFSQWLLYIGKLTLINRDIKYDNRFVCAIPVTESSDPNRIAFIGCRDDGG